MRRDTRLRVQISLIVAVGTLIVAVGVALVLSNTFDLRNTSRATVQTDDYLAATTNLERLVIDAETGLRGYVITGRPLFLAPTHQAQARLPGAIARLRSSVAASGLFRPQAAMLIDEAGLYFSTYVPHVLRLTAHDPAAARSFQTTLTGKRQADAIRVQARQLEALVAAREATRQRAADHTASRSIAEAIVVLVVLTVLTALLGTWLGRLAVERERARERSDRMSQSLQESILPAQVPRVPGCELAIRFTPEGGGTVGGDFYDVFEVGQGSWAVLVGDVCGKGAAAAAISAMARWTLRSAAASTTSATDALRMLNDTMLRHADDGRFVTIAYLLITIDGQRARATIACAGHPEPVLVPAAGEPRSVGAYGDLLGVWADIRLHEVEVALEPGDSLVAYTDGVTDQGPGPGRAPEQVLGERPPGADAERLASIVEGLAANPSGQRDDIAILALRFTGDDDELLAPGSETRAATTTLTAADRVVMAPLGAPGGSPGQIAA
jgi:serine phosphatase RsbU (regulator of sigma subunit)